MIERVSLFKSEGYWSLDDREHFPDGLTILSYMHFNPGRDKGWIDAGNSYLAIGEEGQLKGRNVQTSQFWIVGAKDPSYGKLRIRYHDKEVIVSCWAPSYQPREILFASDYHRFGGTWINMSQVGSDPVDVHVVYHTNNDHGIFAIDQKEYQVKGGDTLKVNVTRVNGTGNVSVLVQTWPDTARANEHYKDVAEVVEFGNNETWKIVEVEILKKSHKEVLNFTCRLSLPQGAILGLTDRSTIHIAVGSGLSKGAVGGIIAGAVGILGIAVGVVLVVLLKRPKTSPAALVTVSEQPLVVHK
jgi:hypothetical protein